MKQPSWISTNQRILITGFSGLVGFGILEAAIGNDEFIGVSLGNLKHQFSGKEKFKDVVANLLEKDTIHKIFLKEKPTLVLHLAAATDVDRCQKEPKWAYAINVDATKNLVDLCADFKVPFMFISTDYVFPRAGGPFSENDLPASLEDASGQVVNVYGETKRKAESIVQNLEKKLIIRLVSPYNHKYTQKTGTPPAIVRVLKEGKPIKAVYDSKTTYTYGPDIALALNALILNKVWENKTVVHIAGHDQLSAFDLVNTIKEFIPSNSEIQTISHDEYFQGRAPRPLEGGLKTETLDELGVKMHSFLEVLETDILPSVIS